MRLEFSLFSRLLKSCVFFCSKILGISLGIRESEISEVLVCFFVSSLGVLDYLVSYFLEDNTRFWSGCESSSEWARVEGKDWEAFVYLVEAIR